MSRTEARVETDRPARYGKQLVAHLTRRSVGEWHAEEERGDIIFDDGRAELSCDSDALLLRIDGPAEALARLEDVVGRHLVRFGARDELVVSWVRDDGRAGTEQRNPGT